MTLYGNMVILHVVPSGQPGEWYSAFGAGALLYCLAFGVDVSNFVRQVVCVHLAFPEFLQAYAAGGGFDLVAEGALLMGEQV